MPMRSPGGGNATGVTGADFARAGRAAGFFALGAARLTGAFFAGFFAGFLRATGRLAGAFLGLAFAFFRTAMFSLPAGHPARFTRNTERYILFLRRPASNRAGEMPDARCQFLP